MKKYSEVYRSVKPSIVAIASKISFNPEFPDIIGTGFIARPDGIIFTNEHVIKCINKLPRHKNMPETEWPAFVIYFHNIPELGILPLPFKIMGAGLLGRSEPPSVLNYGPDIPDLGFIHVHMKDLPALTIADKFDLEEGDNALIAGFPLGTETLRAPGWMHQFTPTLQTGIISAILPFPCENPHAILLDIMTHGGSSGSPVISPESNKVIGLVYAGLLDTKIIKSKLGTIYYKTDTSLTLAIPSNILSAILAKVNDIPEIKEAPVSEFKTVEGIVSEKKYDITPPKMPTLTPVSPDDIVIQSHDTEKSDQK